MSEDTGDVVVDALPVKIAKAAFQWSSVACDTSQSEVVTCRVENVRKHGVPNPTYMYNQWLLDKLTRVASEAWLCSYLGLSLNTSGAPEEGPFEPDPSKWPQVAGGKHLARAWFEWLHVSRKDPRTQLYVPHRVGARVRDLLGSVEQCNREHDLPDGARALSEDELSNEPTFLIEVHDQKYTMAWSAVLGMLQKPEFVEGRGNLLAALHSGVADRLGEHDRKQLYRRKLFDIRKQVEEMKSEYWVDGILIMAKRNSFGDYKYAKDVWHRMYLRIEAKLLNMAANGPTGMNMAWFDAAQTTSVSKATKKRYDSIVDANKKLAVFLSSQVDVRAAAGSI